MRELSKTKVTVRLRKAEFRKEWYIYLESYPVSVPGKEESTENPGIFEPQCYHGGLRQE